MAGRSGIETMLALMDEAFRGVGIEASNESQALLPNLATVADSQWRALPPGAAPSIESIAVHGGACKVMYDDYAFGPGTKRFGTTRVEPWQEGAGPRREVVAWLEDAHERLVANAAALASDEELDRPRRANWAGRGRPGGSSPP